MNGTPLPTRRLVAYARPESFAENTLVILRHLGCRILTPGEFAQEACELDTPMATPDLYLAESRRLDEVPDLAPVLGEEQESPPVPVVLLTGEGEARVQHDRVVGTLRSPAGMHELYRLVQEVLEEVPRSAPRVPTEIAAVCRLSGRRWDGTVVSLSENGCLLRSDEAVELGTELLLSLPVPGVATIHLHAETAYQIKADMGLVFSSTSAKIRESINEYVTRTLIAGQPASDPATQRASG